jgi:hypothetical protein
MIIPPPTPINPLRRPAQRPIKTKKSNVTKDII